LRCRTRNIAVRWRRITAATSSGRRRPNLTSCHLPSLWDALPADAQRHVSTTCNHSDAAAAFRAAHAVYRVRASAGRRRTLPVPAPGTRLDSWRGRATLAAERRATPRNYRSTYGWACWRRFVEVLYRRMGSAIVHATGVCRPPPGNPQLRRRKGIPSGRAASLFQYRSRKCTNDDLAFLCSCRPSHGGLKHWLVSLTPAAHHTNALRQKHYAIAHKHASFTTTYRFGISLFAVYTCHMAFHTILYRAAAPLPASAPAPRIANKLVRARLDAITSYSMFRAVRITCRAIASRCRHIHLALYFRCLFL